MSSHAFENFVGNSYFMFSSKVAPKYFRIGKHSLGKQKLSRIAIKIGFKLLLILYIISRLDDLRLSSIFRLKHYSWHIIGATYILSTIALSLVLSYYQLHHP